MAANQSVVYLPPPTAQVAGLGLHRRDAQVDRRAAGPDDARQHDTAPKLIARRPARSRPEVVEVRPHRRPGAMGRAYWASAHPDEVTTGPSSAFVAQHLAQVGSEAGLFIDRSGEVAGAYAVRDGFADDMAATGHRLDIAI